MFYLFIVIMPIKNEEDYLEFVGYQMGWSLTHLDHPILRKLHGRLILVNYYTLKGELYHMATENEVVENAPRQYFHRIEPVAYKRITSL